MLFIILAVLAIVGVIAFLVTSAKKKNKGEKLGEREHI
jgi:hypothetical protein